MRYLAAAALALLVATPALAASPARIGAGSWVVAAPVAADADRVCLEANGQRLVCATAEPTPGGVASLGATKFKLTPAVETAAVFKLDLTESAMVRARACRTTDGLELCSALSSDSYQLAVVAPPAPPTLIDVEAIRAALDAIEGAIQKIRDALPEG